MISCCCLSSYFGVLRIVSIISSHSHHGHGSSRSALSITLCTKSIRAPAYNLTMNAYMARALFKTRCHFLQSRFRGRRTTNKLSHPLCCAGYHIHNIDCSGSIMHDNNMSLRKESRGCRAHQFDILLKMNILW
mmetsp:Transcript_28762/g.69252  ORF Transcript_28762/g.69252 Transcript_28762/m.69252 type:complete len:133 (+) Transcript_28762:1141-1539(+)